VVQDDNGTRSEKVARIPISMQKKIVQLAAAFLCGRPIKVKSQTSGASEENMLKVIKLVWSKNKLDYLNQTIARHLFSETEVAELWYTEAADQDYWKGTPNEKAKFRLRMKIICHSKGDKLYPVFNSFGDMIAFGRGYYVKVDGTNEEHFDLYTDQTIYLGKKSANGIEFTKQENVIGKIPVIYYNQEAPEWNDVQELIERLETLASNHADTNDYFGSPVLAVAGKVEGLSKKGESGKVFEMTNGSTANYLSWDQSPKSVELEYNNLFRLIFELTDTPNISFEAMKGLGTFSGIALKMLFLGAHLKASSHAENFGMGVQRRINYIKESIGKLNIQDFASTVALDVTPEFEYYLPKDETELINLLTTATGGKAVMSQETAVAQNDLIEDKEKEMELIKAEKESEGALNEQF
jgi:SPP1 family phage portal protein